MPAEALCIRWLETRTQAELEIYPQIVQLARSAIAEAFSNKVITPGVTTTEEVRWWLRERYRELGLPVWFQPHCNVQRRDPKAADGEFFGENHTVLLASLAAETLHTGRPTFAISYFVSTTALVPFAVSAVTLAFPVP